MIVFGHVCYTVPVHVLCGLVVPPTQDDDEVPASLDPLFRVLFAEQWPFLRAALAKVDACCHGQGQGQHGTGKVERRQ